MAAATHVVLIRGINVGGRNPVPMARLRAGLEQRGLRRVRTYIQSGNVVVVAPEAAVAAVAARVERLLAEEFGVDTVVVVVSAEAFRDAIAEAPQGFGEKPDVYHEDVAFLKPSLSPEEAMAAFRLREGVDEIWQGTDVVYFRRLSAQRTRSRLSAVMSTPQYRQMTIRNWRTTTTIARMLDDE
jgi:uncharacterized protein (DUF1697 family)